MSFSFAFSGVSSFYSEFMRALGSSQRVFELLDRFVVHIYDSLCAKLTLPAESLIAREAER